MKVKLVRWARRLLWITAGAVVLFFLLDLLFPLRVQVDYAPVILARDKSVLHTYLTADQQWRMNARLEEITPQLREAIVFKEDKRFYAHPGIDLLAIGRAAGNNMLHARRTSGASTITMQVARLLYPGPRTYWQKVADMFRALQLEKKYTKDELLQLYLNLVPYGSNIQGVKAAALLYFEKSPDQLSLAEITALSIIPNRPNSLVMGKDNARIVAERNKWLQRFADAHLFPEATIRDAMAEPLRAYRHTVPRIAPQFCYRMRRAHPGADIIHTSLDAGIQAKTEDITAAYMQSLALRNVHNAAIFIVSNRTHQVVAYAGSHDFSDKQHHGEVDGVMASRSPGSALKPFLYGLAFDRGLITPMTIVTDVPVNYAGYTPENYDLDFRGPVTISDALRLSLNIPAVKTLHAYGVPAFHKAMIQAGFQSVQSQPKLGLSMILGGCTVRLDEMVHLYAGMANGGVCYPFEWTISRQSAEDSLLKRLFANRDTRVLSAPAAYVVHGILSELTRPDLPNLEGSALHIPRIAWKTGTSYGHKDAWSIGYNQQYTIGVWVGNFDGTGVPGISGAGIATPLLFQLFNAISTSARGDWMKMPAALSTRFVCAASGRIPGDACDRQVMDYYIPGVASNEACNHVRDVYLSADESFAYCTSCLPPNGYKVKQYEYIEPELAAFYTGRHIHFTAVPPHNPSCTRIFAGTAPTITTLRDGMTYLITDTGQSMQLACTAYNDVNEVFWYVNDRFLGKGGVKDKLLFIPTPGHTRISCSDDKGRTTHIYVTIKRI